jgi:aminopeptidase 2
MCKLHQGGADAVGGGSVDVTKGRVILPANVKPVNYDLTLEPDFEKFSFEGTVEIE